MNVDRSENLILSPLFGKLGRTNNFIEALDKNKSALQYSNNISLTPLMRYSKKESSCAPTKKYIKG